MANKLIPIVLAAACFTAGSALSEPIVVSLGAPLTLTSSNLGTAGTAADRWLLGETFTAVGSGVLQFTDADGTPLANSVSPFTSGSYFSKTVLNNSGVAWTSFEMELQQILGTASGEGDGLSFAQGAGLLFSSNVFLTVTRIDNTRDYLNFSGGVVPIGGSVTFFFTVTDNSPQSPFFLAQTPNRVDRQVPEPTSLLLLGIGLAALGLSRRKRAN